MAFLLNYRRESIVDNAYDVDLTFLVEDLAVTMFEHGILGKLDVKLTQAWLMDLSSVGYEPSHASS